MTIRPFSKYAAAAVAIALAVAGGYRLGRQHAPQPATPVATAPATNAATNAAAKIDPKTGRPVLYWHDPMAPGQKFDRPGRSPFMDMDLVPVYADEAAGGGVTISPSVAQNLGLRTAVARRAAIAASVEAVGTVAEDERSIRVVQSRVAGFVEKLHVRANLDRVAAGQPVVTVFAPDWVPAQDEYLALRRLRADAALVDAARQRLALLSIPEEVIRAAEASDRAQSRFTLRAPAGGVVADLAVREGAMVAPGMTLLRIVDLGRVWIHAEVPEAAASEVAPGMAVRVQPAAFPGRTLDGRVAAILPQLSAGTRTLRVRIELANPGQALAPGMLANVAIAPKAADAVLVPQESVIPTGRRTVVVVQDDAGRFRPVEVETGRAVGADIEIRSGLAAGEKVVVSGQFLLDSEASLKSALPRLATAAPPDAPPAAPRHEGTGRVEAIAAGEVTLAHDPIASLKWPAMSMPFRAPAGVLPARLAVGDRVKFALVKAADGDMELAHVEVLHAHGGRP